MAAVTGRSRSSRYRLRLRPLLSAMLLGGALPVFAAAEANAPGAAFAGSDDSRQDAEGSRESSGRISQGGAPAVAATPPGAPSQLSSGTITLAQAPQAATTGTVAPVAAAGGGSDASVVGDDEFLAADELDEALPDGPRPQSAPVPARAGGSWGLAPIRWGGVLSAGIRQRTSDTGNDAREQVYEARLRANSYLMQPWIALISGDVALTMVRSQTTSDGTAASNNLAGTSVTGNGSLSVFPQSRFPFQASLGVSDNRSDGTLVDSNTSRVRLALRQDYRPETGNWSTSGQYDRSELSGDFGRDTVDVVGGTFNTSLGKHSISANGSMSRNRTSTASIDDRVAVGRHAYRFNEALLIDTNATYTAQEFDFSGESLALTGDTKGAQIFSMASWTPYDSPWRGSANFRYFKTENNINETRSDLTNLGGSASLSYQANRNLSVFGSLNANSTKSSDGATTSLSETLGLNYSGDPRLFGEYSYNWYGSGALSNASASSGENQRTANATVGHGLQRLWQLSALTMLSGNLSQSVSATQSTGLGSAGALSLTHSASMTLQANPSDRLSGFLGASVSDNRTSGDNASSFQLLNVQLSGRWRINALSELNSNLTWQLTRQDSSRTGSAGLTTSTASQDSSLSGNLGYSHIRVFGVRGLRYTLDFRANTNQTDSREAGNPDATRERATLDLDQRLRYSIGRLDTELQVRVAEVEGRRNGLIFFKASRAFGGF